MPRCFHNFLRGLRHAVAVEHVALKDRNVLAVLAHPLDRSLARLGIHVENGDLRAAAGQRAGDFAAQDARAASDGDRSPGEIVHPRQLRQVKRSLMRELRSVFNFVCSFHHRRSCHIAPFPFVPFGLRDT